MCARLLGCPLCSQPGFVTLDALRAGLVSVATRPLACPVCDETLLGIDKLTIHLFGHTIGDRHDVRRDVISDAATFPSWNIRGARTTTTTTIPDDEVAEKIDFSPMPVVDKDQHHADRQRCTRLPGAKNRQGENEGNSFAGHLNQRQQFSSGKNVHPGVTVNISDIPAIGGKNLQVENVGNSFAGNLNQRQQFSLGKNVHPGVTVNIPEIPAIGAKNHRHGENAGNLNQRQQFSSGKNVHPGVTANICDIPAIGGKNRQGENAGNSFAGNLNQRQQFSSGKNNISAIGAKICQGENAGNSFAGNLNQRQQFSAKNVHPGVTTTISDNIQAYAAPVMIIDGLADNERANSGVSATNSRQHNGNVYEKNFDKKFNGVARKEETQFAADTWIENLWHEDSKCFSKASSREDKSRYSTESQGVLTLPEEKYRPSTSIEDIDANAQKNDQALNKLSLESGLQRGDEMFNGNPQGSLNFKGLLPQWKAFRLLAMKEKTERCDICGIHFPDVNFLVLHKQLAHMIPEKDANAAPEELLKNCPCHLCTKVFKTRGTLMVHMRVAHMGYNLGFLSKDKESESPCSENGFNCPTCGKNFKKEQHVTQHLKTHEGKQWECDVCSKMFTTKYFLKKHKRLHSGEMPYKCTICEKTFTFQQSYHKHRLYHKDDKPHTCATCGRSFKELSTLHNHERIHTGEKPFVCETCGKCFRQRVSYLVHRRIHTGVMPYKCTVCGKSFRYKVSQRTHKCPVQSEEAGQAVPETAVGSSSDQPSSSRVDCSTIPKTEIFLQHGQQPELAASEGNKFILIVNTQGQPILTKETDANPSCGYLNDERRTETANSKSEALRDDGNDLWNNCLPQESVAKETDEKLPTSDANDFFSLVMSPMENDLSSPSTEMEHLRLSSPQNDESRQNETRQTCQTPDENSGLQRDLNSAIEGIFRDDCAVNGSLQTINEDSLKELLYGIDRKD